MTSLPAWALAALVSFLGSAVGGVFVFLAGHFIRKAVLGRLDELAAELDGLRKEEQGERAAVMAEFRQLASQVVDVNARLSQGSQTHARLTREVDQLREDTRGVQRELHEFDERLRRLEGTDSQERAKHG